MSSSEITAAALRHASHPPIVIISILESQNLYPSPARTTSTPQCVLVLRRLLDIVNSTQSPSHAEKTIEPLNLPSAAVSLRSWAESWSPRQGSARREWTFSTADQKLLAGSFSQRGG